ncbi:hypothetical protein JOE31_003467 [Arthrobacter sp. PvP023]|uniref:hypothetical protein n=1 Tax=Micrococcaceae TaxID=1268 RepID=UPI001AE87DC2|nr:hypothetical protein [Arthrobacter sp. PvP023]MBP1137235.1 hypothetical protein [Arthrobacter sp. PvP023]
MESAGFPWRALRPLLLAGAAATAWLTLSAPAASADTASDSASLLGSVSSSVSSVTAAAINPVEDVLAAAVPGVRTDAPVDEAVLPAQPSSAEPAGLLQPLTGAATGPVDYLIEVVPVVNQIVPSGTVGAVTAPVTAAADGIVTGIAEEVLPIAGDALPVLDPVVEPVGDLLAGVGPLPGPEVLIPNLPVPDIAAADDATADSIAPARVPPVSADAPSASDLPAAPATSTSAMSKSAASFHPSGPGTLQTAPVQAGILADPLPRDGTPSPAVLPAVPGSGSGSSQSQGGGAGGAAWLSAFHLDVPLTVVLPVSGPLQSAPAPVSFDPGSSPD